MSDLFEVQGRWWLPEHDDHRVFGVFRWDPAKGGELRLDGVLRPIVIRDHHLPDGGIQKVREPRTKQERRYPVIRGQVEGKAFTLTDAFQTWCKELSLDEMVEKVFVNRALEGAWFDYPQELDGDRLLVRMRHLTSWVDRTGLAVDWDRSGSLDGLFTAVKAVGLAPLEVETQGVVVRLGQHLQVDGDTVHHLGISQEWRLSLHTPEPSPVEALVEVARDLQDLVSIASGDTAAFESVQIQHPSLRAALPAGRPTDESDNVTYYVRWSRLSDRTEPVDALRMFFTLTDLGGMEGVARWLSVASRFRTELARTMATRYSQSMFLEDRIMNVCAALDSFDMVRRQTSGKVHFKDRILACVGLAGPTFLPILDVEPSTWASMVKDARNDLAHHRATFRTDGSVGEHLLAEQLYWLFTLGMLRLAEAPPAVFDRIGHHNDFHWLSRQARGEA